MSDLYFIQNPLFCAFVSNGSAGFVSDRGAEPVLFKNQLAEIAHKLWQRVALPRHQGDLLSGIVGLHHEAEVSQVTAKMLQEGVLVTGSEQDIADLLRRSSPAPNCDRLLVCMTGAIQAANFNQFLIALRFGFCRELKIILTAAARKFVRRRALGQLLEADIHVDAFKGTSKGFGVPHIALSEWASCILVAPATAATICRIAHGSCDDLLSLTVAAAPSAVPVVIGPSMNARMWENSIVRENVRRCREHGYWVIEPGMGVETNTAWNQRIAQGGVFGAGPMGLVKAMRAIQHAHLKSE